MKFTPARRLTQLPPYLFVEIDRLKEEVEKQGKDVIDLGVGDPDTPTPRYLIQAMRRALGESRHHQYPSNRGLPEFREAIARYMKRRFGVALDPATEILPLIGSKEGIAHLPLAFVNPGDTVWVPDPGYPPYGTGTILAGGRPVPVPLKASNRFLPDLNRLKKLKRRAKLFFLNYPNNPTAATATLSFFRELVRFTDRTGVPICHDAAYAEIYTGKPPVSFLQAPGAKAVGIEFHSLSKPFNMTGWRAGWVCGNREMVSALAKVKSNIDSGVFQAIQITGIAALRNPGPHLKKINTLYRRRREVMVEALQRAGWPIQPPQAAFYLWAPIPKRASSRQVAADLLTRCGIVATPGIGFGKSGEGFVRFSLTLPDRRLKAAAARIGKLAVWPKR